MIRFQFIPYFIPLFISALILITLAIYAYRYRSVRGATAFIICMLIGSLWALGNALEMTALDLGTKLFWANIQYIAYAFAPLAWLVMVLQFTDRSHRVNKRNLFLLSIIPLITITLVWTDNIFGLVRYGFSLDRSGAFPVIAKNYGPWFWIHFAYCYLLNFITIVLLFRMVLLKNTVYQRQAFHLLTGFFIVTLFNILYISGLSPYGLDITPISFSIAGIIIGWGIFRFRLFDLVPIARETVIEKMGSGIVVIDTKKRVIDINPRARKMLNLPKKRRVGQSISSISPELQELITLAEEDKFTQKELALKENNQKKYYELYISQIRDYRSEIIARVLILNDITDLKLAREQLNQQREELAVMDERDRMARDLHDNLGQIISFSNIQIPAIRKELKNGNLQLADQYLKRLNEIIKNAHRDIREYVYNIRNKSFSKKDFKDLLYEEVESFLNNSGIEVEFIFSESISATITGTEEKLQLIHIVKEAVTNVIKHADADNIMISIEKDGQTIELSIKDNGKGITAINRGSGLTIMNERARLIGGRFKIESQPGKGTKVIVSFPVMNDIRY